MTYDSHVEHYEWMKRLKNHDSHVEHYEQMKRLQSGNSGVCSWKHHRFLYQILRSWQCSFSHWPWHAACTRPLCSLCVATTLSAWLAGLRQAHSWILQWNSCFYLVWEGCWSLLFSAALCSRADSLCLHVILHEWLAFYSTFMNIHESGVLSALTWLDASHWVLNCWHSSQAGLITAVELRNFVKVEVAIMGSLSLIVLTVSVDVKQLEAVEWVPQWLWYIQCYEEKSVLVIYAWINTFCYKCLIVWREKSKLWCGAKICLQILCFLL